MISRNSTVTGVYNIYPPCYVTAWYGCYRNCYAKRGLATDFLLKRNRCYAKCYGLGVTVYSIVKVWGSFCSLALESFLERNTCVPDIILYVPQCNFAGTGLT